MSSASNPSLDADLKYESAVRVSTLTSVPPEIAQTIDRLGTQEPRSERAAPGNGGEDSTGAAGKAEAGEALRSIFTEYNRLREIGRSPAWAELQKRLAESGSLLITTGMISLKDVVGTLQNIEEFRKSEGGNQTLPADFIAQWLSEPEPKATPVVHVKSIKEKKTGKKKVAKV